MRHFYKMIEGNMQGALMSAIMQKQEAFHITAADGVDEMIVLSVSDDLRVRNAHGAEIFPALRRLSLAALQMSDGVQLGNSVLLRVAPKAQVEVGSAPGHQDYSTFAMFLHAVPPAVLMAADEAVQVRSGDVWWVDTMGNVAAAMHNRSDDDTFMLLVEVRS